MYSLTRASYARLNTVSLAQLDGPDSMTRYVECDPTLKSGFVWRLQGSRLGLGNSARWYGAPIETEGLRQPDGIPSLYVGRLTLQLCTVPREPDEGGEPRVVCIPWLGPRKNNAEGDGLSKNPYTLIDDDFQTSAAGVDSEGGVDTGVATTRLAGEPLLPLRGAVCVWSASPEGTPPMSNRLLVVSSIEPMDDLPAAIHDSLDRMVSGLNDAHPGTYTSAVMVPTLLP